MANVPSSTVSSRSLTENGNTPFPETSASKAPVSSLPSVAVDPSADTPFLHALDTLVEEWRSIERERSSWALQKNKMDAQVQQLQTEKQQLEKLTQDLLRRVKMLESVVKKERTRNSAMDESPPPPIQPPVHTEVKVKKFALQTREILRKCLDEFGISGSEVVGLACHGDKKVEEVTIVDDAKFPVEKKKDDAYQKVLQLAEKKAKASRSSRVVKKEDEKLGELADVNPQEQTSGVVQVPKGKKWNPKQTLRGHLDGVRGVCFHLTQPILVSASEDSTLKVWDLKKNVSIATLRGHTSSVLCVCSHSEHEMLYSGSTDMTVRVWEWPPLGSDPMESVGRAIRYSRCAPLVGHTDAVWDVAAHPLVPHVLSVSADGTVKIWNALREDPLLASLSIENDIPTSSCFLPSDRKSVVSAYKKSGVLIFDSETSQRVSTCELSTNEQINRIAVHPTASIAIAGHEDGKISLLDINDCKVLETLVGHQDGVSSVAFSADGLSFASVGHDESLRIWDFGTRRCSQEVPVHRRKYDEGIHDVAIHSTRNILATCGADCTVRVFQ